jgi:hypothetical protein
MRRRDAIIVPAKLRKVLKTDEEKVEEAEEKKRVLRGRFHRAAMDVSYFIAPRHLQGSQKLIECK